MPQLKLDTDDPAWSEVEALLDQALDLPADARETFIADQQAERPALAGRVLVLLRAAQASTGFMDRAACTGDQERPLSGLPAGTRIGIWELQALIGSGGMGEVYRARRADGHFRQQVALKLIAPGAAAQTTRFLRERQILAQLDHPGIGRLLDGGLTEDERPYMAMEFVRGESIVQYCHAHDLGLDDRLRLLLAVCDAVSYAHARLIVHRDIKPDNVLVDDEGRPRLLDFGIALLLSDSGSAEMTQALATPSYAAPEQLSRRPITTATDTYALGGLLFAVLTQRPPLDLRGQSLPRIIDRVLHETPPRPSAVCEGADLPYASQQLRGDLDAICARALRKNPARRYASAEALAADLRNVLEGQPVVAREGGKAYRSWRFVRRHQFAVASVALLMLSLLAGLIGTGWQARLAADERDMARREADRLAGLRSAVMQLFSASSSDPRGGELTARGLFQASADRIEQNFSHDQGTAATLMQMLGKLHLHTEDYASARRLLEQALDHPDLDPAVRADAHYDLAQIALRDGEIETARELSSRARDFWAGHSGRYQAERIWSTAMASQLARVAGDAANALSLQQQAADAAIDHWGEVHPETGIVLINLAVAHYYANQLPDALRACASAWDVWVALGRRDSPDALNLLANWGLFAIRHGDLAEGERRLQQALNLRRELYPESAAEASLLKNLGSVRALNGHPDSLEMLTRAHDLAARYAGTGGALHASASHALARELLLRGQAVRAEEVLRSLLQAANGRDHLWLNICRALLGETLIISGQIDAGTASLDRSIAQLHEAGAAGQSWLADALAARAQSLRVKNDLPAAQTALEQAYRLKRIARSDGHHETLLLQHRLGRLLEQTGAQRRGRKLRADARQGLRDRLGADHHLLTLLRD